MCLKLLIMLICYVLKFTSMKRYLRVLFAAFFVLIAGLGIYTYTEVASMSELTLANVEALADNESSSKGLLYSTKPDANGQCLYCCCPGDNDCTSPSCSGC